MSKIGFIGTGIMGKPMAQHLINGDHQLFFSSHFIEVPSELLDAGGTDCATPREVAQKADIIITMVPDTPQVEDVLFGESGVINGLSAGKIVIDMSSISPMATKEFAKRINAVDCEYVDAPVSSGELGDKAANLTIMVGAKQEAFDRVRPIIDLMGKIPL